MIAVWLKIFYWLFFFSQYLRHGCTQYFTSATTEKNLSSNQKSSAHGKKGSLHDPLLDDITDFQSMDQVCQPMSHSVIIFCLQPPCPVLMSCNIELLLQQALVRLGISEEDRLSIYAMVASVLHLGNVCFEDNPEDTKGGCQVEPSSETALSTAANLMGVDPEELRQALVSKVMMTNRGGLKGTVIM